MIRAVPSALMLDLPRFRLFDAPSPFHPAERLSSALGGRAAIWLKRDDLLPLAFGGNKLRNLEFLVGAALAEGADTLVTSGRRWSNHARLTAAAGARAALDVHLILSGPPSTVPGPGVVLDELLGATVHQLPDADRAARDGAVEAVVGDLRAGGHRPYVIGVGGSGALGAYGQVLAAGEAFDQAAAAGVAIDAIVLPSATGGTQAGLLVGCALRSPATVVDGIVVGRPAEDLRPAIEQIVPELAAWTGASVPQDAIRLDAEHLGDGYGRRTEAGDAATRLLARTEGVLVDPIYTAKALAGLIAAVQAGRYDGQTVVFWHAGGTPGLFEPLDAS
jgi:1-aminocyclopropane-1-carboxylate deaminase/D-cysteine desulfhydrase-like pyridoxal-dependent ACC family enzyme